VEQIALRHGSSRIPWAPVARTRVRPSMTEQFHKASLIPHPEKIPRKPNFALDELPPGIVLGILRELAKTNVKDPVRTGAVSKNCHEAFCALVASDGRFRETLKIFRGEYDDFGVTPKIKKSRHKYKIRRLGTLPFGQW